MTKRLERAYTEKGKSFYNFECLECGSIFIKRSDSNPKSCGCIIEKSKYVNRKPPENSMWCIDKFISRTKCNATCTKCNTSYKDMYVQNIIEGKSLHCNKCKSESFKRLPEVFPDGIRNHKLYSVWSGIKERCYNKNTESYKRYGGSGVTMCDEWKNSAETFMLWAIENGWAEGLQIDKDILSEKLGIIPHRYSPETCMFVTGIENMQHTRELWASNTTGVKGVSKMKNRDKYEAYFPHNGKRVRCGYHNTVEEARDAIIQKKQELKNEHTR